MGEAKRKREAMLNGDFWTFATADDHIVKKLSLNSALNFLGYYTVEQAKEVMPGMTTWDIAGMKVNNRIYQSVKRHCLKTGILFDVRSGASIYYSPPKLTEKQAWQKYQDYCQEQIKKSEPDSKEYRYYMGEVAKCLEEINR